MHPRTRLSVGAAAAAIALTALPVSAAASATHQSSSARSCGVAHYRFEGDRETGTIKAITRSCATARSVLKRATKKSFDFGDSLPAGKHYRCQASQRPGVGYHPRFIVTCSARGHSAVAFGITST